MKTHGLKVVALFMLLVGGTAVMGQDAEVPGDNFSLEGALELFKKSQSPEEFEKMLNSKDSKVNNLDLNGDGYIDYVRVVDRTEDNIHTFTMQAVISDNEVQDVAVITLEKKSNGKAVLQIIGDEDVYGMETIIEPTQEVRVNAGTTTTTTVVNVWAWPAVQYVYSPSYVVWASPWSWTVRPVWWYHWHPVVYYRYDSWWRPYRPYYTRCYSPRIVYASRIYRPHRVTSVAVHRRHETQITRYRSVHREDYERSRSRYADNNRAGVRENSRQRDNRSERPTVRTRSRNDDAVQTRSTRNRESKPVDRSTDRTNTPVRRERTEQRAERNSSPVQRERSVSRPAERQRPASQPRMEKPQQRQRAEVNRSRESSQPRMSSPERNNRSGGHSSPRSAPQGERRRSR